MTATTRPSRPPPSSASTRSCRGRPAAASCSGAATAATKAWAKWDAVLVAATKQSRRPRRPVLARGGDHRRRWPRGSRPGATAYVLHEDADVPLAGQDLPEEGDVLVVVGPEGGIAPEELEAFRAAGAAVVRLGDTVLRSSSAGPAALAVLSAADRWR